MESRDLLKLRRLIGFITILMIPTCLLFSTWGIPWEFGEIDSYSAFYWSDSRNLFVGAITVMSIFYLLYPGYSWLDKIVNIFTGICMYAIVIFPCWNPTMADNGFIRNFDLFPKMDVNFSNMAHIWFGTANLLTQAINVGFLFTKHGKVVSKQKKIRNVIYYSCSGIILFFFLFISILSFAGIWELKWCHNFILKIQIISFTLIGFCWLIKGRLFKFLNDPEIQETK